MRVVQPAGTRGSLRWIQRAVAERWDDLEQPIVDHHGHAGRIDWRSPLEADQFAEYRDVAFLRLLGLNHLAGDLANFWPTRGPQWDALCVTEGGQVLLVEAKAHIADFCTPASQAGVASMARITATLERVAGAMGSQRGALWHQLFYQYANRLAHLWFLREQGVDARLVLVGFLGDSEVGGPSSADVWQAAYRVADYALDLGARHPLSKYIIHVFPRVRP